jgi:hypothetical protein
VVPAVQHTAGGRVAAYASYEHQRWFAAAGGADPASARLWPLSVDGLVLLASVGLLRTGPHTSRRNRCTLWLAFGLGIAVSLAANIAASPALGWQPILVAGWPPIALLLAVELLAHRSSPDPHPDRPQRQPPNTPSVPAPGRGQRTEHRLWWRVRPSSGCGRTTGANAQPDERRPAPN